MKALLSDCGAYRYLLTREIDPLLPGPRCLWVMLNPSTADAKQDDPTIRRCIGFARAWGCTAMTVVNLFALRATDPVELFAHRDPVGPENASHVVAQLGLHRGGIIVAAWGACPAAREALPLQQEVARAGARCLGTTKDGSPRHPLYVRAGQSLLQWEAPHA